MQARYRYTGREPAARENTREASVTVNATICLAVILLAVLAGPLLFRPVERNIEIFFFLAGGIAAAASGRVDRALIWRALSAPIGISLAVLVFGALARVLRPALDRGLKRMINVVSPRLFVFALTIVLGLVSSVITAVVAALVLVEALSLVSLDRESVGPSAVIACFAIGLGAALTPLGQPLSAIAGAGSRADFWYLARLLGPLILPGIALAGMVAMIFQPAPGGPTDETRASEGWWAVVMRAARIYIFVVGLIGLAAGVRPLFETYLERLSDASLFWLNTVSAVVDNATLASIELGPHLRRDQELSILMSLLVSGGMLVPGNIPNIIAADRLEITARQWARVGLPIGFALLLVCFGAIRWLY